MLRAWCHARVCGGDARMLNSHSHQFNAKLRLLSRWTETKKPESEAGLVQDFAQETGSHGRLGERSAINQTVGKTQCSLLPQQHPELHHPLKTAHKSQPIFTLQNTPGAKSAATCPNVTRPCPGELGRPAPQEQNQATVYPWHLTQHSKCCPVSGISQAFLLPMSLQYVFSLATLPQSPFHF